MGKAIRGKENKSLNFHYRKTLNKRRVKMAQAQPPPHHGVNRPAPLGPFNPNRKHSEPERWICIYPAYFNSNKTRQEGRLLPKEKCVPNPNHMEIRDVLMTAGYQPIVENKQYPRERSREFEFRGRIRVQLRNDDGTPHIEKFKTRESIMEHLGEMIPKLKSRQAKPSGGGGQENQPSQSGGGGKKNKKK